MAIKLVTGHLGSAHISSEDVGALLAGVVGPNRHVISTGGSASTRVDDEFVATLDSATSITIGTGQALFDGRHVRVTEPATLEIPSGTTMDTPYYIGFNYAIDSDGVESVDLSVSQVLDYGDINAGSTRARWNLYQVRVNGSTVTGPTRLFSTISPLSSIATSYPLTNLRSNTTPYCNFWATNGTASLSIENGTTASQAYGTINLCTIPAGFRPKATVNVPVQKDGAASSDTYLIITNAGNVSLQNAGGSQASTSYRAFVSWAY